MIELVTVMNLLPQVVEHMYTEPGLNVTTGSMPRWANCNSNLTLAPELQFLPQVATLGAFYLDSFIKYCYNIL